MRLGSVASVLLLSGLLLAPLSTGAGTEPWAPLAVKVLGASVHPVLSWLPGPEEAESFLIYGVASNGSLTFLGEQDADPSGEAYAIPVPAGYAAYGVQGVRLGIKSAIVRSDDCVKIYYDPPAVGFGPCSDSEGTFPRKVDVIQARLTHTGLRTGPILLP